MRDYNGVKVQVTPSVLYSEETAIAGIDGGEQGHIFIKTDGMDHTEYGESRQVFMTVIYDSNGEQIYRDDDLRGPAVGSSTALEGLRSFISFLLACAESKSEDGENFSLFPPSVREWAEMVNDELAMISSEIDEELGNES